MITGFIVRGDTQRVLVGRASPILIYECWLYFFSSSRHVQDEGGDLPFVGDFMPRTSHHSLIFDSLRGPNAEPASELIGVGRDLRADSDECWAESRTRTGWPTSQHLLSSSSKKVY